MVDETIILVLNVLELKGKSKKLIGKKLSKLDVNTKVEFEKDKKKIKEKVLYVGGKTTKIVTNKVYPISPPSDKIEI